MLVDSLDGSIKPLIVFLMTCALSLETCSRSGVNHLEVESRDQMCAMCHSCGSELMKLENGEKVIGNESSSKLESGANLLSCKVCGETRSSPCMTPMISPTISLSSSDSSISSSSKF